MEPISACSYFGFWYQKIARATSATVMIHRTTSFVRFFSFSSAIGEVQHTSNDGSSAIVVSLGTCRLRLGCCGAGTSAPVAHKLQDFADVNDLDLNVDRLIHARVNGKPVSIDNLPIRNESRTDLRRLLLLYLNLLWNALAA